MRAEADTIATGLRRDPSFSRPSHPPALAAGPETTSRTSGIRSEKGFAQPSRSTSADSAGGRSRSRASRIPGARSGSDARTTPPPRSGRRSVSRAYGERRISRGASQPPRPTAPPTRSGGPPRSRRPRGGGRKRRRAGPAGGVAPAAGHAVSRTSAAARAMPGITSPRAGSSGGRRGSRPCSRRFRADRGPPARLRGPFRGLGTAGADVLHLDHDRRDVVDAAPLVGEVDEAADDLLEGAGRRERARDLLVGDHPREPVGAEEEPVAGADGDLDQVDGDVRAPAEGARDDVLERVALRLLLARGSRR